MTKQGKFNLLGIVLLPLAVVASVAISAANGVWEPTRDTYVWLFTANLAFMLVVALLSALLLLWAGGERSRWLAVAPTMLCAIGGGVWYLWSAMFPADVAPGWEFLGGPQYLLVVALGSAVLVFVLRLTGIVSKTA